MPPAKPKRTERLQVILTVDEGVAIDTFRFQTRMPSRAAAVRELLRRGLVAAARATGKRMTRPGQLRRP